MFPLDLLHGLLRHSLAAHKRETIAFGRLYRRDWETPELASDTRHRRVLAY